nr:H-NS family nucleoid-associated regulatory protein [Comamonas sp. UBA7528]
MTAPLAPEHPPSRATHHPCWPAKYHDPATGATWTGRGKEPVWIRGQDRDAFLITSA